MLIQLIKKILRDIKEKNERARTAVRMKQIADNAHAALAKLANDKIAAEVEEERIRVPEIIESLLIEIAELASTGKYQAFLYNFRDPLSRVKTPMPAHKDNIQLVYSELEKLGFLVSTGHKETVISWQNDPSQQIYDDPVWYP